jgi:predicted metalloendopeptidase
MNFDRNEGKKENIEKNINLILHIFSRIKRERMNMNLISLIIRIVINIIVVIYNLLRVCNGQSDDNNYCSTQACEREAKNILEKIDPSINACDDLYMHVCGSFIKNTIIPDDKTSIDVSTKVDDKLKEQLNEVLSQNITDDDIEPFKHSKKLFKACINEGNKNLFLSQLFFHTFFHPNLDCLEMIQKQGLKPMQNHLDYMGGWPVVEGKRWQSHIYSWQRVNLELEKRGFGSNYLYDVSVEMDMKNSTRKIIYVM